MYFSAKEMEAIFVFHAGTLSATLESLREASELPGADRKELLSAVIGKLSGMKPGDTVSLAFDPE